MLRVESKFNEAEEADSVIMGEYPGLRLYFS